MLKYVFDASAVVRLVDQEAGSDRVEELLRLANHSQCTALISAVNWGEVVYTLAARPASQADAQKATAFLSRHLVIVEASADRAARAGLLKLKFQVGYADAFGLGLASDSTDHILVTADYGVKAAEQDIRIDFLPAKTKQ